MEHSFSVVFHPLVTFGSLFHVNLGNCRLAFGKQGPLIGRQCPKERQLHPLHRGFDTPQGMTAQRDFMRGEDQAQPLLFALVLEFGEGELIER